MALNMASYKKQLYTTYSYERIKDMISIPLETLLTELFNLELDQEERKLMNEYEKSAILYWSNPEEFLNGKYNRLQEIISKIESNGWQAVFLRLFSKVYRMHQMQPVICFVFTEMSDTWDLIGIKDGKYVVGIDYDNTTYLYQDRENWSTLLYFFDQQYKLRNGRMTLNQYVKKIGNDQDYYMSLVEEDIFYSKMLSVASGYITPKSLHILPKVWMKHKTTEVYNTRKYKPTSYYVELLRDKHYLLDRKGVTVKFQKGVVFEQLVFLEVLNSENRSVLLVKAKFQLNEGETIFIYDIDSDSLMSAYSDGALNDEVTVYNNAFKNFILEVYTELVCDFEKDDLDTCLRPEDGIDSDFTNIEDNNILYSCEVYHPNTDGTREGTRSSGWKQRSHKRTYSVRELPKGWKTSDRARELAEQHNIILREGETFVSSYVVGLNSVRSEIKKTVGRPRKSK